MSLFKKFFTRGDAVKGNFGADKTGACFWWHTDGDRIGAQLLINLVYGLTQPVILWRGDIKAGQVVFQ